MTEVCEPFNRDRVADERLGTDAVVSAEEVERFEDDRRRALKEMGDREASARETIFLDFLEIADNLERAIAAWKKGGTKSQKSVKEGIESVLRLFRSKLERYAVTPIEAEGRPFDPRLHHAVSQASSADAISGTVLHEVQKGYQMNGRLLRPAVVVVATSPTAAPQGGTSTEVRSTSNASGSECHSYQRNRR